MSLTERIITAAAIFISILALFVSIRQTSIMSEQKDASVWPYVQVGMSFNSSEATLTLDVSNDGLGPARITDLNYSYKDSTFHSIQGLAFHILKENGIKKTNLTYYNLEDGRQVLIPGKSQEILMIKDSSLYKSGGTNPVLQSFYNEMTIQLTYCSIYDHCWINVDGDIQKL